MNHQVQKRIADGISNEALLELHSLLKKIKTEDCLVWNNHSDFEQQAKIFETALEDRNINFDKI